MRFLKYHTFGVTLGGTDASEGILSRAQKNREFPNIDLDKQVHPF